jgi:hypothetical protein
VTRTAVLLGSRVVVIGISLSTETGTALAGTMLKGLTSLHQCPRMIHALGLDYASVSSDDVMVPYFRADHHAGNHATA